MKKALIKVYVGPDVKARLVGRAGRETLSSFVSGLIDSYFEEYPGNKEWLPKFKAGDVVNLKMPARFVPSIPQGEEPDTGQSGARSSDASAEVASRRLPKSGPHRTQKSIPADVPSGAPVDMKRFLP